jgi:hypothetical protein
MILEDLTMDEWMDLRYEEGREEGRNERDQYFLELLNRGISIDEIKEKLTN